MRALLLALALLAPFAPFAGADHWPRCPTDGLREVTAGSADATFYADVRDDGTVALYQETNGLWHAKPPGVYEGAVADADLQRGGASPYVPDDPELCVDEDALLWLPDAVLL